MRIRVTATITLAFLAAALLAQPTSAAPNGIVASASGSGHMVRNGFFRTFTFSAQKHADGTSRGQLQLRSPEFDVVVHLNIDCLRVVGNRAHLSGVITYTSNPAGPSSGSTTDSLWRTTARGGTYRPTWLVGSRRILGTRILRRARPILWSRTGSSSAAISRSTKRVRPSASKRSGTSAPATS